MKSRAAVAFEAGKPLEIVEVDLEGPKAGEVLEVKTLISHPMENGLRKDATGKTIPIDIIKSLVATYNGKEVFSADFEPAIAANPYIQCKFSAQETGPVVFTWVDDDGSKIVGEETIKVS